jgi:hypothetical protein
MTIRRGLAVTAALIMMTSGCSARPGVGPLGAGTAAPTPTERAAASLPNTPTATAPATIEPEEPITYPPDNMWDFLSTAPGQTRRAENLAGAVDFAELIVIGKYIGVERGPGYGPEGGNQGWYAVALIQAESVVQGSTQVQADGLIRVPFLFVLGGDEYPAKEFADLQRSLPADPALLFLYSWKTYWERAGDSDVPAWLQGLDTSDQYKTIGADGVLRIVDGRVEPMAFVEAWPTACSGTAVEELVGRIERLLDNQPSSTSPC